MLVAANVVTLAAITANMEGASMGIAIIGRGVSVSTIQQRLL
jgi:hypothetical protein